MTAYEEVCQGYVNDHRSLCWCGLPEDEHDGREMDAAGDMHRFNERRTIEPESRPDFGDSGPRDAAAVVAASVSAALSSPAPKTTDKQPASALTLLRAAHALLGHMDQAWISGKPVKQHLVELRSLRYRIEEALR